MRWWEHLYLGERAGRAGEGFLKKLEEGRCLPDDYVITLPQCGNHLFDIRPALLLTAKEREGLMVLGAASGYGEAKEVVRRMVDDMYQATGGFDWGRFSGSLDSRPDRSGG